MDLQSDLDAQQDELLDLARRQFALEAFLAELERVTKGKEFTILNDIVWTMILDSRDVLVIRLASWAKAMNKSGGFLPRLENNYRGHLKRKLKATERTQSDPHYFALRKQEHAKSYVRLFPNDPAPNPHAADVQDLRNRFAQRAEPVLDDRNDNRAHPYEKSSKARAVMLSLEHLREFFTYAEQLLNDIRHVAFHSGTSHSDMNYASTDEVAKDLVDTLLLGPRRRILLVRGATPRDEYYGELHAAHDASIGDEGAKNFNDFVLQLGPRGLKRDSSNDAL